MNEVKKTEIPLPVEGEDRAHAGNNYIVRKVRCGPESLRGAGIQVFLINTKIFQG
jgi:hypothetical protein